MLGNAVDVRQPYLNNQLIAYIGSKRALLPFLYEVFSQLSVSQPDVVFSDPFAGTGAVSRLAKVMGFEVRCNDWEPYAHVVNRCHIGLDKSDMKTAFARDGGIEAVYEELNSAPRLPADEYIARYYAPRNTGSPDYRTERLFYTRENALFIDRIREFIETTYPDEAASEHTLLLASLIYQAGTHVNTSGVFKAYHRGFGGYGRDALKRIMKPMALQIPLLIDGYRRSHVRCEDALTFVRRGTVDICYLDPPYNQHQYGSNYHLLNTITMWDKPVPDNRLAPDGRLKEKAGIRKDWQKTKSPFCYRESAGKAMRELLDAIDARYIVISYNTEGIIPFPELYDMLAESGAVSIQTSPYIVYRGGKQSLTRTIHNQEFVFVVDRNSAVSRNNGRKSAERFMLERKLEALLTSSFHPERLNRHFLCNNGTATFEFADGKKCTFGSSHGYTLTADFSVFSTLQVKEMDELISVLEICRTKNRQEEAEVILQILEDGTYGTELRGFQQRLLRVIKKYAFKKYRHEFEETLVMIRRRLDMEAPEYTAFAKQLREIERIAALRFGG